MRFNFSIDITHNCVYMCVAIERLLELGSVAKYDGKQCRAFSSLLLSFIYSRNQQQVDASARRRRELWNNECINIIQSKKNVRIKLHKINNNTKLSVRQSSKTPHAAVAEFATHRKLLFKRYVRMKEVIKCINDTKRVAQLCIYIYELITLKCGVIC